MVAGLFALVAVCFGVVVVGQFAVATVTLSVGASLSLVSNCWFSDQPSW